MKRSPLKLLIGGRHLVLLLAHNTRKFVEKTNLTNVKTSNSIDVWTSKWEEGIIIIKKGENLVNDGYVLVLDCGTQSMRSIVYDTKGFFIGGKKK